MRVAFLALCVLSAMHPGRVAAQNATILAEVDDTSGVMLGGDGRIYGTNNDSVSGNGTVFSMNPDGSGFANLHTVTGATLFSLAQGGDGRLYGVANGTAQSELFALTTDGATYSILHTFIGGVIGAGPTQPPLIIGRDGRLYGITQDSAGLGVATIFAINTDGTGFTTLYMFPNLDGFSVLVYPTGVVQGSDGRLYGTTEGGMEGTSGTVFALNTDGTGYTELHVFEDINFPYTGVIQGNDGRLYGVFLGGGSAFGQYVFALNIDGSGYTVLCPLELQDAQCETNLLQGRDGRLYGMGSPGPPITVGSRPSSAAAGQGLIFSVALDGSDFEILCAVPAGYFNSGLVQDANGRLYGSSDADAYSFLAPLTSVRNVSIAVGAGGILTLTGGPPAAGYSYQWLFEGADVPGATGSQLTMSEIGTTQAGDYTLLANSPSGKESASTTLVSVTSNSWLTNLSARARVDPAQSGGDILIAGFVTTGTSGKKVLVRGVGPSLAAVGVSDGLLADPKLTIYSGQSVRAGPFGGWDSSLATLFLKLGAFPLPGGSTDAATSIVVSPGAYTAELTSQSGQNGMGLVEIYDADQGAPANRLTNLSARGYVGTGDNVFIGGFVIAGSSSKTVLIRGIGPGLEGYISSPEAYLPDPVLTVFDSSGRKVATINHWNQLPTAGSSTVAAGLQAATIPVMNSVGAFVTSYDTDAAMVLTLPRGSYTVQVSSASGATGTVLFEVYEVP
jgi:uncharacterized repeat protein (TIGR03803 family)